MYFVAASLYTDCSRITPVRPYILPLHLSNELTAKCGSCCLHVPVAINIYTTRLAAVLEKLPKRRVFASDVGKLHGPESPRRRESVSTKEFLNILCSSKAHYQLHKSSPLVRVLKHISHIHTTTPTFPSIPSSYYSPT
jgi:hypothetical protein